MTTKQISYLFFYPPQWTEADYYGAHIVWERLEQGLFTFNLPALQWLRIA